MGSFSLAKQCCNLGVRTIDGGIEEERRAGRLIHVDMVHLEMSRVVEYELCHHRIRISQSYTYGYKFSIKKVFNLI